MAAQEGPSSFRLTLGWGSVRSSSPTARPRREVGRGWFIVWVDWWLRHVDIFRATLGAWWPLRNGSMGVGPSVAPSAHLGPRKEGWDVPHGHIPCQRLHSQVPVISQQDHLPQQADGLLCWHRKQMGSLRIKCQMALGVLRGCGPGGQPFPSPRLLLLRGSG